MLEPAALDVRLVLPLAATGPTGGEVELKRGQPALQVHQVKYLFFEFPPLEPLGEVARKYGTAWIATPAAEVYEKKLW